MDPIGNVPLFLTALKNTAPQRRRFVVIRELCIAFAVMLLFLAGGREFMKLFSLEQPALAVAGGLVLVLIALRMIFPTAERNLREHVDDEPFIVPLAVPYVAGPSLLAMEIVVVSGNPQGFWSYLIALVVAWFVSALVLVFSNGLSKLLGVKTMLAIERLMGMVLVIIATQMILRGVADFFRIPR